MPREIELQIRAIIAAFLLWLGTAGYENRFHDEFWGDMPAAIICYYFACIVIMGWDVIARDMLMVMRAIKDIITSLKDAANGKDKEVRGRQSSIREIQDGK